MYCLIDRFYRWDYSTMEEMRIHYQYIITKWRNKMEELNVKI